MEMIEIRATQLLAQDVDFLRPFARRAGHANTGAAVLRYAVKELARRLRRESAASPDRRNP